MKIFLKILFITVAIIVMLAASGLILGYEKYKNEIVFTDPMDGKTKIKLEENEKDWIKKLLKPVITFIYHKATIYNPAGDVLPDRIDNDIRQNIKDGLRN